MKTTSILLSVVALLFVQAVQAESISRQEMLRFTKAVGIYEQIEEQKMAIQAQGAQAAQQYAQQISASAPGLPDEFKLDMQHEMEIYMSKVAGLIDTDFAVDTYIDLISKKLSASEIKGLTEFYESDLGKKFTQSNTEIMNDWTLAFMGDFDKKMMVHLQSFTNNLMAKASNYSSAGQ